MVLSTLMLVAPSVLVGQIEVSGQLDLVGVTARDSLKVNSNFRGDSPFNPVRLRLFAQSWITERIGIFGELLYDIDAAPRVNGAYIVVNELAGASWLNARVGLAPNLIGSFGLRSTYFNSNPLIGVPLVWHYRTNLSNGGTTTVSSIGAASGEPGRGVPMLYDSCWNVQWELLGEVGDFEYSLGFTPGSLSNPVKSRFVAGSQALARLGYVGVTGLRLGLSAAHGPYLSEPAPSSDGDLPYPDDPATLDQTLLGGDMEYAQGRVAFHSEVFASRWETPLVPESLDALGGYAELRFDIATGWYVAGRLGGLFFSDILTDPDSGARGSWDDDTRRTELALGYRMSREVLVKLDWQRTTTRRTGFEQNLLALQLSSVF